MNTSGTSWFKQTVHVLVLTGSSLIAAGCASVDDKSLEPLEKRELENRHLTPAVPDIAAESAIPDPVSNSVYLPIPEQKAPLELFTVSASDIPVRELLFSLARDADLELDIYDDVSGNVTINAIDQTLPGILKRITEQAGLVFELRSGHLVVKSDTPIWRTYEVDYLNVQRSVESQVVLNMSVSAGPGENSDSSNGSQTSVNTTSESTFWKTLEANILALVTSAKSERMAQQSRPTVEKVETPSINNELDLLSSDGDKAAKSEAESTPPPAPASTETTAENDVIFNRESGVITVYADSKTHAQLQALLDRVMSRVRKEVLIEATIVEVELFDDFRTGVDWAAIARGGDFTISQSTIGGNFADVSSTSLGSVTSPENLLETPVVARNTFGFFGGGDLALNLQLVQRYGDTQVLSSPKIMAINNQTALLKVVDNYVYFGISWETEEQDNGDTKITYSSELNTVPVGLIMSVTPFIGNDDEITLSVRPTISRIVGFVEDPAVRLAAASLSNPEDVKSEVPLIREREMEAVLKVRNGQTAVIGGLMQDSDDDQRQGLPGLEQAPLIGDAFAYQSKNRKKSELVIFIRPVIVESPDVESGDLKGFKQYLPGNRAVRVQEGL